MNEEKKNITEEELQAVSGGGTYVDPHDEQILQKPDAETEVLPPMQKPDAEIKIITIK